MANIKIKTKGMHCGSCEKLLKESLEEVDGINKADASVEKGIVAVNFNSSKVSVQDIVELIQIEGYEVE